MFDYGTAVFLAIIALTGLVSVVIYKVKPKTPKHNSDQTELLTLLREIREVEVTQVALLSSLLAEVKSLRSEVSSLSVAPVGVPNNNMGQQTREKLSKKLIATADWIVEHDPDSRLSVRQVASACNVSKGTAERAIKMVRDERSVK